MTFDESTKRWNWINGFVTAALHAAILDSGMQVQVTDSLTFQSFISAYIRNLSTRLSGVSVPSFNVNQNELRYIFHLESELWAENPDAYWAKGHSLPLPPLQRMAGKTGKDVIIADLILRNP